MLSYYVLFFSVLFSLVLFYFVVFCSVLFTGHRKRKSKERHTKINWKNGSENEKRFVVFIVLSFITFIAQAINK